MSDNEQTCYLGNGNIVPNDTVSRVCDTTGTINSCCPLTNVCLSNGLCYGDQIPSKYFKYTRFACTDPVGTNCVPNCASSKYNNGNGDAVCGNQFTGYCCWEDHANGLCDCDTGENAFTLPYGTPISTIGTIAPSFAAILASSMSTISSLLERGITIGTIPATATGSDMSSATGSATSSTNVMISTSATSLAHAPTGAISSTISPSASNSNFSQATQGSNRLPNGAEVGIVVGVVLFIVVAGISGWIVLRVKRFNDGKGHPKAELPGDERIPLELSSKRPTVELSA